MDQRRILITTRPAVSPLLSPERGTFSRNEWLRGKRVGLRLIGLCGPGGNNETMLREEPPRQEDGRRRFR